MLTLMSRLGKSFGWMVLMVLVTGCGSSDLGSVSGKIHLDGEPLANAVVTFYPENADVTAGKGAASFGRTDESGYYELHYNRDAKGAEIGAHKVAITTLQESSGGDYGAGVKELVPTKYNSNTELTAQVTSGSNRIDFLDLDSKGRIEQGRGY